MSDTSIALPPSGDAALLAKRYIGALYALAEQAGVVDAVATDMRNLRRLWAESADWRMAATDPRFNGAQVAKAIEQIAPILALQKLTTTFLAAVAQNRRLALLPSLVEGFLDEVTARRGEFRADVRTARALTAAQSEALTASLTAVAGGKVHLKITEDASILGGLTIKLGSQFIDASVRTRLDHLERTLKGAA